MMGYPKYTMLAWSGAAITAIMIASEQPEKVSGLITWGAFPFATKEMVPKVKSKLVYTQILRSFIKCTNYNYFGQ